MAAFTVVRAGLLTTVQDLGRTGWGRFGISPSGAMDPLALRVANRLLGNDDGAPALEITGPGVELRADGTITFALAWGCATAAAGALLRFRARRRGARAVLAVPGGFQVTPVLGSVATDLDAGLGGGRLPAGHQLHVTRAQALRRAPVSPPVLSAYDDPFTLRFIPEQDRDVLDQARALFLQGTFRVSDRSNRTGYRLSGDPLPTSPAPQRLSEPVAPGTIQLPPDGAPILLMADRQTTGGYPRLGHLIAADRPKAAQLWPSDAVRFTSVTIDEAHRHLRGLQAAWEMI
jgi:biotin-dependent carboxylase-like uncharacterized protein